MADASTAEAKVKRSFSSWFKAFTLYIKKNQDNNIFRADKQIESLRSSMERVKDKSDYERAIRKEIEKKSKAQNILGAIPSLDTSRDILTKLKKHKSITDVFVCNDGYLNIITVPLKNRGQAIGRYRISLQPSNGGINVFNLDKSTGSLDHWAVKNNVPCLGEYSDIMHNCIARGEIFFLFDNMIHYLSMTGSANAYMDRNNWMMEAKELGKDWVSKKVNGQLEDYSTILKILMTTKKTISEVEEEVLVAQ